MLSLNVGYLIDGLIDEKYFSNQHEYLICIYILSKSVVYLPVCLTTFSPPQEPNMLILHDQPRVRIHKEFINQGVIRADPEAYLQRYRDNLVSWRRNSQQLDLVDEATRTFPPPPSSVSASGHHYTFGYPASGWNEYHSSPPPHLSTFENRMKSTAPLPHSIPYHHDYSQYDFPHCYSKQSPDGNRSNLYPFNDYRIQNGDVRTMIDVTPSWELNCHSLLPRSHLPSYQFSSSYAPGTIHVNSESEFQKVLSDLTHEHVPSPLRSC